MTAGSCLRLFEVEALRDNRLGIAERKSFERHLATCAVCAHEADALDRLAEATRADVERDVATDELRLLRDRTRLLSAFDRTLMSPERPRRARHWVLFPSVAAALVAGLIFVARVQPGVDRSVRAGHAEVRADATALWSKRTGAGNREEILLEKGLLWIHVEHPSGEERLVVLLPDGELEDVGTTFTVSADGGHTTRVAVEDGRVSLRLRGRPAVDVGPGDVWLSAPGPATVPSGTSPPGSEQPRHTDRPSPHRISRLLPTPPVAVPAGSDPLVEFRAGMEALRTGDNHGAATAFTSFLVEHPGNPMAEDAAYLRVIALQRAGASRGMKLAAEDYLRRFPTGFRRVEVQKLFRASEEP